MTKKNDWGRTYQTQTLEIPSSLGYTRHLIISRHDGKEINVTWDVLQEIKDSVLGKDVLAVEIFPPTQEIVNEVNWRHLWEVPVNTPLPSLFERNKH